MRPADTSAIRDEISRLRDRMGVLDERLAEIDGVESRLPVRSRRETLRDGQTEPEATLRSERNGTIRYR